MNMSSISTIMSMSINTVLKAGWSPADEVSLRWAREHKVKNKVKKCIVSTELAPLTEIKVHLYLNLEDFRRFLCLWHK